jgi:hypothetical protein
VKRKLVALNRCHACAVAGLACAHLAVLGVTDAAHPHERKVQPTVEAAALPPEPPHTHQDYDRSIRIAASAMTVSGTSSSEWVPSGDQQANWATRWPRDSWDPAYYVRRPQIAPLFTGTATHTSSG